ncbi:MAG: histidine kinase [Dissulfurimicrobium sp.]|uniref:histidine kinase n=1 Tax=Dissulfurimicrobium sp. TaxID=2022436 RepID=UPI00404B4147
MEKNLLQKIITAQEEERRRIARELHDQVGQALASLMLELKLLEQAKDRRLIEESMMRLRTTLTNELVLQKNQTFAAYSPFSISL